MYPRKQSSNLVSAGIKSLRFYRHVCRMIPYLLKIHEMYFDTDKVLIEPPLSKLRSIWETISEPMHIWQI